VADGSTYGALDLSLPDFASRTRLYHLRPLGIGTPMVESLTGYIVRLAGAHVVSPGALMYKELGQGVGTHRSSRDSSRHCYISFVYDAHTLNGMTENAEKWAAAVGEATGIESIRFLTMLPWRGVFSAQGVTRTKRAWCVRCYQEWRAGDLEIYEPLLWMLAAVSTCPLHQQLLTTICPHCGREPHVISCRSRPGHCSRCGRWLGAEDGQLTNASQAADFNSARSIAEAVGTLLARAPTMDRPPSVETLRINLQGCLDDLAEGNESLFGRAVEMNQKTLEAWLAGRILPALGSLLKICRRLELSLCRFVAETMTSGDSDWEHAREVMSRYQTSRARCRRVLAVRAALDNALAAPEPTSLFAVALKVGFKHEKSLRAYDPAACNAISDRYQAMQDLQERSGAANSIPATRVEEVLEVALRQDPPPSIRDVSLILGLQEASCLVDRFPGPCCALVERSREYRRNRRLKVEQVLRTALIEEPPPTVKEVAKRVGHRSGQMLRLWFPDLYRALAARASQRRDWRLANIRAVLEVAVTQEPPPSGEAVAAKAGVTSSYLRDLFPCLWRELVARHATFRSQSYAKNRQRFQEEARRIARELLIAGKYPSRRRVQALLPESKLNGAHLIVCEVKKVVGEFRGRGLIG